MSHWRSRAETLQSTESHLFQLLYSIMCTNTHKADFHKKYMGQKYSVRQPVMNIRSFQYCFLQTFWRTRPGKFCGPYLPIAAVINGLEFPFKILKMSNFILLYFINIHINDYLSCNMKRRVAQIILSIHCSSYVVLGVSETQSKLYSTLLKSNFFRLVVSNCSINYHLHVCDWSPRKSVKQVLFPCDLSQRFLLL